MKRIGGSLLVVLALAACSGGRSDHGTIRGDVFVALETGEEVNAGGRRVALVPEAAGLDSALALICAQRRRELAQVEQAADTARAAALRREAVDRAWRARADLLAGRAARSALTGADSRFVFDSVRAGEYRLWADAEVQGQRWTWLHPVEVRGGDTLRVSLNNANPDGDPFKCQL